MHDLTANNEEFSIFLLENSSLKCPDTCEKQITKAKQSFESKKLGQNLKRKYLVDGLLKNEQVIL